MAKKQASVKRILNCIPSRDTESDWTIDTARDGGVLAAPAASYASVSYAQEAFTEAYGVSV